MLRTSSDHIQALFSAKAKNDPNSSTLAQTLETNIFTAFKGEHKFIFELLQNADDSSLEDKPIAVDFTLTKSSETGVRYLIFSHTGAHFSEQDVEKICDNSQQFFQDKSLDSRRIGYKGIGFKAVFSIASCVHVISGEYNFRFDQNHFLPLKKDRSSYPWPIIPIPNVGTELPSELKSLIKKNQVTFVLKIRPEVNIENEMQFIKENRVLMLFLRNVHLINLIDNTGKTELRVEQPNKSHKQFFVNGKFIDGWVMEEFVFDIPEVTQRFLGSLQDSECPQRLKAVKQTKIMFAAQTTANGELVPYKGNQIFSYLPTQVNCGFPYVVNGDFLLNTERTRLVDNDWNAFLFDLIGYCQLQFLAKLSPKFDLNEIQTFKLLPERIAFNASKAIEKAYSTGFERGVKEVAFVPSLRTSRRLVKVSEVIVDNTGFYENFDNFEFGEGTLLTNSPIVRNKFIPLFQGQIKKQISLFDVWGALADFAKAHCDIKTQHYILSFLTKYLESYQLRDSGLKDKKIVFSSQGKLCCPNELYLPAKTLSEVAGVEQLELVHPNLLEFSAVLKKIGVRQATRIEFIRRFVKPDILNAEIPNGSVMSITRLIFEAMQSRELEEEDWTYLKKLPVKTKWGDFKRSSSCYLSKKYQPALPLEAELPDIDIFVSNQYARSDHEYDHWKQFFKKIGVMDDIKVHYEQKILVRDGLEKKPHMTAYLEHVGKEVPSPSSGHEIQNFMDIDLYEHASLPTFSAIFWGSLLGDWHKIERYSKSGYRTNKHHYEFKKSYLQFCIGEYVFLPVGNNQSYPVNQLFMPALRECIGDALPVASLSVNITEEQAIFFGFKTKLTVPHCLQILDYISGVEPRKNPDRYAKVFKYLLSMSLTELDKSELKKWSGQLLSKNNTLQSVKKLQHCCNPFIDAPQDQIWLKPLYGMSESEMIAIANLFAIPIVSVESVEVLRSEENTKNSNIARHNVLQKLPVMALMHAHQHNSDPEEELGCLMVKYEKLVFTSFECLKVRLGESVAPASAYLQKNRLYFEKEYNHVLTKNAFCKMVSLYFQLGSVEAKNLEIYLYLDNLEDLQKFLEMQQLNIAELPKTPKYKSSASMPPIVSGGVGCQRSAVIEFPPLNSASGGSSSHSNLGNHLQILQQQLEPNPKSIGFEKMNFSSKKNANSSSNLGNDSKVKRSKIEEDLEVLFDVDLLNEEDEQTVKSSERIDQLSTGRAGEKIVYEKLKSHYILKYPRCQLQETRQGFKLVGQYIDPKTEKSEAFSLELVWPNKGLPVGQDNSVGSDFTICKNGVTRHIEVKASASSKKGLFRITMPEWDMMRSMQNLYRIFRVTGVNSNNLNILKIKNPFQQIQDGNIPIKAYDVKL